MDLRPLDCGVASRGPGRDIRRISIPAPGSPLQLHPSGLYLHVAGFPGVEGFSAGFTTLRARGSLTPVLSLLGWDDLPVYRLNQVHGTRILALEDSHGESPRLGVGDGLATSRRGIVLAVAAADCVPLILFDPRSRAGAVLHAGWRGTLGTIAAEGVRTLREVWGARPGDLAAVIGPSIGPCCYAVGAEVLQAFLDSELSDAPLGRRDSGTFHLDLPAVNRFSLERAGMDPGRILSAGLCTRCRPDLFPSYRRDGVRAGRLLGFLGSAPSP